MKAYVTIFCSLLAAILTVLGNPTNQEIEVYMKCCKNQSIEFSSVDRDTIAEHPGFFGCVIMETKCIIAIEGKLKINPEACEQFFEEEEINQQEFDRIFGGCPATYEAVGQKMQEILEEAEELTEEQEAAN